MMREKDRSLVLDDLLRRCVGCGLCLPHCATWVATGNEVHSPRGRLLLLEDLLNNPSLQTETAYAEAFDHCIGCRACETACPSGVPFSLLEHGRNLTAPGQPFSSSLITMLSRQLDSVSFLKTLRVSGDFARKLLRLTLGSKWRIRLDTGPEGAAQMGRLLGSVPVCSPNDMGVLEQLDGLMGQPHGSIIGDVPLREPVREVAMFSGCANEGLLPGASRRLTELLVACGCRIYPVEDQQCCGALAAHTGRPGKAARLKRSNLQTWNAPGSDRLPIVVEAAGCGMHLKQYGEPFDARILDAVTLLDSLTLPEMREVPLKVVYHDPCHALHGQGIARPPRRLLKQIPGLVLLEPLEAEVCCGSGGAWGLHHRELSDRLGRRKARNLAATGAHLVVTSNPGCLGQVADGLAVEAPHLPIVPLTDLLWFACFSRKA